MSPPMDLIGRTGLKFFGTMTASISHEIKNVLAIINENAGLMKDLSLMARKGMPLDLDKVEKISTRFEQQVARADHIVKGLNQFAHTIDAEVKPVEVEEAVAQVLSLAHRFISMKNCTVDFKPSNNPSSINSNPFLLNNLLWFCLEYAMENTGPEKKIGIHCMSVEAKVRVSFSGIPDAPEKKHPCHLFSEEGNAVLQSLGGEIGFDPETDSMILVLPKNQTNP
jgi:C4-dicarboxylate-specific signal transduction histidine kinase